MNEKEVRDLVSKANMQARRILEENMDKVHKVTLFVFFKIRSFKTFFFN